MEALGVIGPELTQQVESWLVLHAFGDRAEAEPTRDRDDAPHDAPIEGVLSMIARIRRSLCPNARSASTLGYVVTDAHELGRATVRACDGTSL